MYELRDGGRRTGVEHQFGAASEKFSDHGMHTQAVLLSNAAACF